LRIESLRDLIILYDQEIRTLDTQIAIQLRAHHGYRAIQVIPGVGPVLGAIFVAEIGQVERFSWADKLCSWAGLTPKHRESDVKVVRRSGGDQGPLVGERRHLSGALDARWARR
jgi:transposase